METSSGIGQFRRMAVLLRRLIALRLAATRVDLQERVNAALLGMGLAAGAVVLGLLGVIFALLALSAALQTWAHLSPAAAHLAVAGGVFALGAAGGLLARRLLRSAFQPKRRLPLAAPVSPSSSERTPS
jgi:hypothetical protein